MIMLMLGGLLDGVMQLFLAFMGNNGLKKENGLEVVGMSNIIFEVDTE